MKFRLRWFLLSQEVYSIDILNPIHCRHYTREGDEVNFKSKDYWYFAL